MPSQRCCLRKKGAAYAAPFSCPWGMKKGPSKRAVLDGTGCGGAVPSSRGQKGSTAACCRSGKHGGSIVLWPGKAMPRARSVQFDTLSRRQGRRGQGVPVPEQGTLRPVPAAGWGLAVYRPAHLPRLSAVSALSGQAAAAIQRGYQAEVPPQGPAAVTTGGGDVGQSSTSGKSCGKMFLA